MTKKTKGLGQLEQSLQALEELVEQLEHGDMPLEKALAEFERGIKLTKECQAILKDAEQKIEILLQSDQASEPEPFAIEEPGD